MASNSCATFRSLLRRSRTSGAATPSRRCCARSTFRTSRSIPARATAACTTASSTTSATTRPQMLLCLHEEAAVAIAHGYAKASGRMMGVVLHSNVGLMHGTMAIFNAWCDRVPMLILGATGPWDAAQAPAVDRLDPHRVRPGRAGARLHQVGQPAGLGARRVRSAAARGADRRHRAARPDLRQPRRRAAGSEDRPAAAAARRGALSARRQPVVPANELVEAGGAAALRRRRIPSSSPAACSRSESGWKARVALAEKLQATVFTDIKTRGGVPDRPSAARRAAGDRS